MGGESEVLSADLLDTLSLSYRVPTQVLHRLSEIAQRGAGSIKKSSKAGEAIRAMCTCTVFNGVYELVKLANMDVLP